MLSKTHNSIDADHIEENHCLESGTDCETDLHPEKKWQRKCLLPDASIETISI